MAKKSATTLKKAPGRLEKIASKLQFFNEVLSELKKAVWPTRKELTNLTLMVIIICLIVGIILGALDYGFFKLFNNVLLSKP